LGDGSVGCSIMNYAYQSENVIKCTHKTAILSDIKFIGVAKDAKTTCPNLNAAADK